ncbi:MAG: sulfite exporter TauE/SafE family protein [Limosilactobacillus sp.]|uniref:sulfite exporter TauE/SafE family protein n=1 Tax=Limosilactobacillus sp. TaxID=2773925 RepID=UPI0026F9A9B0|nr:sulfite exporter TauE/SafE family protein [Limosilactobacillus sp.]
MDVTHITLAILAILLLFQIYNYGMDLIRNRKQINDGNRSPIVTGAIGFVTNFFDTLGIGSYAPTTMLLKLTKALKSDKLLPGTLNVGCAIPVMTEAFMYIKTVKVDGVTLLSMVICGMIGSFTGSKVVSRFEERKIQVVMGCALAITALLMISGATGFTSHLGAHNTATGLYGWRLYVACAVNLVLGMLMSAGIGIYAPCMALVYLLGLSPLVAFPIMMSSAAAVMPIAAYEFIKQDAYSRGPALSITICGCIGVLVAITFVKHLDVTVLMWLVIIVVIYTSVLMLVEGIMKFKNNN